MVKWSFIGLKTDAWRFHFKEKVSVSKDILLSLTHILSESYIYIYLYIYTYKSDFTVILQLIRIFPFFLYFENNY